MPLLLVPLLLVCDQIFKLIAERLLEVGVPQTAIPGLLDFTLIYNTGAAFGVLRGGAVWLAWVNLIVAAAILYYLQRHRGPWLAELAYSLIAAGALGNAIDRFGRGSVIDYLDLTTGISFVRDFAIFNFADCCVVVGVGVMLLASRRR